jgi:ornithine cyclodeaminase
MVLFLSAEDVESALPMRECINTVKDAFANLYSLKSGTPLRTILRLEEPKAVWLIMPTVAKRYNGLAVKLVSEYPRNPEKHGLPKDTGVVLLADYETGKLLSVQRSSKLTAIRTGATSGLATELLSNKSASSLGIIGTGVQAATQLEAVLCVRQTIKKVRVYGRTRDHADSFVRRMSKKFGVDCMRFDDPDSVVSDSDILIAATNSAIPVFHGDYLRPGCHINSIGTLPERRELDEETFMRSRIFVDLYEGAVNEAGDLMDAIEKKIVDPKSVIELSAVLEGKAQGRSSPGDITLFKSVGFGLLDLAAATKVYEVASQRGIGKEIEI